MKRLNIYVDIDETICYYIGVREYHLAYPDKKAIKKINKLYKEGHQITYWTARGSVDTLLRKTYEELTERQLKEWGCNYHHLSVGEKPPYDLLICDRTKRIEEI